MEDGVNRPVRKRVNRAMATALAAAVMTASMAAPVMAQQQAGAEKEGVQIKARSQKEATISKKTLKNGLDVIVVEDHSVPLVTVEVAVKNGAYTEPAEFNGLSHLYEHMFFKGNAKIPDQQSYLQRMNELGIVFNGTTSTERVNYFFTLPADNVAEGMEFMRDAITSPKFDDDEFQKEIKVVIGEVDRNESSPYYWFGRAINDKLWYAHPTRKDSLGDRKTITTATTAKMREMQKRYYVPNNSALLIAGDVEPEKAFALAEKMYGSWKRGPDPHTKWPVPEHPPLKGIETVMVERPAVKVPAMQFSWHGPSVTKDPKATYAADVLSYILGQPTSKFYKALVESGVTLGAGLSYYTQAHTGPISVSAQVPPAKIKEAIRALLRETYKLADPNYFTDEQLESAKTILAVQDVYEREKASSWVHTVSFWWAVAGVDYYLDYIDNLNAVTRADIARYVEEYIIGEPFVYGLLLSPETRKQLGLTEAELERLVKEVAEEVKKETTALREASRARRQEG